MRMSNKPATFTSTFVWLCVGTGDLFLSGSLGGSFKEFIASGNVQVSVGTEKENRLMNATPFVDPQK